MELPESIRPLFATMDPYQQRAALLLVILNAAAGSAFKSSYARRWWEILEERARLAALTTADLIEFSSSLSSKLRGQVGRNAEHRKEWQDLVCAGEDALVLDAVEHSAPALIAFVRAYSAARREAWEDEMEAAGMPVRDRPEDELPL